VLRRVINKLIQNIPEKSGIYQGVFLPLQFSFRYMLLSICCKAFRKCRCIKLAQAFETARKKWIQNYLECLLAPVLKKYKDDTYLGEYVPNGPVWIFWWSGMEGAPEVVKRCVASVHRFAGSHEIHILTKENCTDYVKIPLYIMEKVSSGKMGLAHFSDYIRANLLAQYGGLWLDATIFVTDTIPESLFSFPLFTCKGPVRKSKFISDYRWAVFCLGGHKGNIFYRYLADALDVYWRSCDYAVTYWFFDHIIKVAYDQIPCIRRLLEQLPDNNIHRDELQKAMNAGLAADAFDSVIYDDTCFYKLNWKTKCLVTTKDGQASIYARFLLEPMWEKYKTDF